MRNIIISHLSASVFVVLIISGSTLSGSSIFKIESIDDFSGFTIYSDCDEITSYSSPSRIMMIHDTEVGNYSWEIYIGEVHETTGFSNFNIEIDMKFNYTGSMLMQAGVTVGSYYFENGTFDGANGLDYKRLGVCGIWDAWAGSGGKYFISARPDHVEDQIETASGSLATSDYITFNITRINNQLTFTIKKLDEVVHTHQWSDGLSRPLNYIKLDTSVDPTYCAFTNVTFFNINAEMSVGESNQATIRFGPKISLLSLYFILQFGTILIVRKREKTIH
ncbi:MAG: hypothetical protein FK732_05135 [Asgard group archaeon]|nr:hypothetical protein [Asgard group archaeon]